MPQYEVQFLSGVKANYTAIQQKSQYTFYYCTDTHELYLGTELLSNSSDVAAAITRIAANEASIASIQSVLQTIQGDASISGSIRNIVSAAIADVIDSAPETFDTLRELAEWVEQHGQEATQIVSDLHDLEDLVGTLPQGATSTNVVDYINEVQYDPTDVSNVDKCLIIPEAQYKDSQISTAEFPTVIAIQKQAFDGCMSLTKADFPLVRVLGEKAFANCINLVNTNFPSLEIIGRDAFAGAIFMSHINAPNVRRIGYGAFQAAMIEDLNMPGLEVVEEAGLGGTNIKEFYAPSLKQIDNQAFVGSFELEEVHLHSIQTIGDLAFGNSSKLKTVYVYTHNVPKCGTEIFSGTLMDTPDTTTNEIIGRIYVRGYLLNAFKAAQGWSTYASIIYPIPGTEVEYELPSVTASDAGKALIVNQQGQWSAQNQNVFWGTF